MAVTVCASFFAALASDAVAKTGVSGDYRCKPYKARNSLIQSIYGVKLKSNGRYAFTYYGANGNTSGAFSKAGNKLTFSSGSSRASRRPSTAPAAVVS